MSEDFYLSFDINIFPGSITLWMFYIFFRIVCIYDYSRVEELRLNCVYITFGNMKPHFSNLAIEDNFSVMLI